ncbi:MAG: DUF4282 domain-containing protein [Candidatus Heimdallarchaeota archaeon]
MREIQTAYEQGKLSEEDFQKARTRLNRHRRRFRKNQQRIERELAALRFYLTFEGEESYHHEQFEQTLNSVKSKTLSTLSSIIEKSYSNLLMRQKMKDFFGFRKMVSTAIIKFIYILGVIVLTIGGIVMSFQIPGIPGAVKILIGLGAIILGNLLWRIICEAWILVFSIHDILGSVEKILKEK